MSFQPFEKHPGNPAIRHRSKEFFDGPKRKKAVEDLQRYMQEISADPSGSRPELYLSRNDAETCRRFVNLADHLGWPNSETLSMQRTPVSGIHAWASKRSVINWTSRRTVAKAGLTKALFLSPIGEEHQGYVFGSLALAKPTQQVALCDDGLLRSKRHRELQISDGTGWGLLPEPELLEPAMASGHLYGVDYSNPSSRTLRAILLSGIPEATLANVDLHEFGLAA